MIIDYTAQNTKTENIMTRLEGNATFRISVYILQKNPLLEYQNMYLHLMLYLQARITVPQS